MPPRSNRASQQGQPCCSYQRIFQVHPPQRVGCARGWSIAWVARKPCAPVLYVEDAAALPPALRIGTGKRSAERSGDLCCGCVVFCGEWALFHPARPCSKQEPTHRSGEASYRAIQNPSMRRYCKLDISRARRTHVFTVFSLLGCRFLHSTDRTSRPLGRYVRTVSKPAKNFAQQVGATMLSGHDRRF